VEEFLQAHHGRVNEIGKKNGEQEENQCPSRGIEKAQADGEQEGRA
jgi:hypothetical protein